MKELTPEEIDLVSGGLDWGEGGLSVIALGWSGGLATGLFGTAVGGSMLVIDYFQNQR